MLSRPLPYQALAPSVLGSHALTVARCTLPGEALEVVLLAELPGGWALALSPGAARELAGLLLQAAGPEPLPPRPGGRGFRGEPWPE